MALHDGIDPGVPTPCLEYEDFMSDPAPYRAFTSVVPFEWTPRIGALEYTGWQDEQLSWKTSCYIGDWSFVPQIRVTGPDAVRLFSDLSVNSFAQSALGRAKHCIQCNDDGKVIAEGILLRHADDDLEFQTRFPQWTLYNLVTGGYDATASFPFSYKLQLSGPSALAVAERLTQDTLRDVRFMTVKQLPVGGDVVSFLRQGMAGGIGFELQGPLEDRERVYQAVLDAGRDFGIRRLGRRTIQINHLEACFPTNNVHYVNALLDESKAAVFAFMEKNLPAEWEGTPLSGSQNAFPVAFTGSWAGDRVEDLYRSPVEMGWAKTINFDHDFVGRDALRAEVDAPRRVVRTLEFDDGDIVRVFASLFGDGDVYQQLEIPHSPYVVNWTDTILKDGKSVGHSTYPGYSRYFRKALALSFLDAEYSELGTEVTVLWGNPGSPQTEIRARVARAPYQSDDRRRDLALDR
jgi:vanillate/3-O-methylgallate O-demethylase